MQGFKEYHQYDATGLAQLVQDKEVTPEQLLNEAIRRIELVNPKLNAVVTPFYDEAKKASSKLNEGPFSGVPFLLKDMLFDVRGTLSANGSKAFADNIAEHDSPLVKRFRTTGVNLLGKTNTPELGLLGITEPEAYGPTLNPWNTELSPGGSSGGSAAAVASRIVPMASATDGGGSIRIPSSHCGLFGLKPTRGRNPVDHGEHWDGATCQHVLTLSVRDSAAMLDHTIGSQAGEPYSLQAPHLPYIEAIKASPKKLRIAYTTKSPYGGSVDPTCIAAVEHSAKLLRSLGHEVEEIPPAFDGELLLDCYLKMYFGHTAMDVRRLTDKFGKSAASKLEDRTRFLALMGECLSASDFVSAKQRWFEIKYAIDKLFNYFNLFMTPTAASLPMPIGSLDLEPFKKFKIKTANALGPGIGRLIKNKLYAIIKDEGRKNLDRTPFTQLANITGQPAMTVPLYWSESGLPCGTQFIAPFGDETTLFQLAAQLEQAQPWFDKMPDIVKLYE